MATSRHAQRHLNMVDQHRYAVTSSWERQADRLRWARTAWLANTPISDKAAAACWNGTLVDNLSELTNFEDRTISKDLQQGFPIIGHLPCYGVSAKQQNDDSKRFRLL